MAKSIFISHSTKDETIVEYLIDDVLIGTLGFHHKDIFCTSADGMRIASGDDWREAIRDEISSAKVIILVISPHYKESEICQNELGAAWVLGNNVIPVIIEPISYKTVGVIQELKQVEKLTSEAGLDRIKDKLEEIFSSSLKKAASDRWSKKKREFLTKTKIYLKNNPFEEPVNKMEFENLRTEKEELQEAYESLLTEKIQLENIIRDLEKVKDVVKVRAIKKKHREEAPLNEFNELISEVGKAMSAVHPIIRTLIYINYTGRDLEIDYQANSAILKKAVAKGLIDEEHRIHWNNPEMVKINSALTAAENFMKNELSNAGFEELEEEYPSTPLEFDNLLFWENVININMHYE